MDGIKVTAIIKSGAHQNGFAIVVHNARGEERAIAIPNDLVGEFIGRLAAHHRLSNPAPPPTHLQHQSPSQDHAAMTVSAIEPRGLDRVAITLTLSESQARGVTLTIPFEMAEALIDLLQVQLATARQRSAN